MNTVQRIRNRMAEMGRELTTTETEDGICRAIVLAHLVRGVDWNWLKTWQDKDGMYAAKTKLEGIVGELTFVEFARTRHLILIVDATVNGK